MNAPAVLRQQLPFALQAGVGIPELRLQHETARGRGATSVRDGRSVLARVDQRLVDARGDVWEGVWDGKT